MSINPNQQKLAEKLIILNDRAVGMLTRIYNIKKACSDVKSKPQFLSEKALEPTLKAIMRKFPTIDTRSIGSLTFVNQIRADVIKSLSLYYYTFADLLDLKDHICELLTTMDACQLHLDITVNYDICAGYLNLCANYISLMIVLSRVDDRKCVLGLFNVAYELQHQQPDSAFPRLGQLITDYEQPLRKLSEDFIPHSRLLITALSSVSTVYPRRNLTADQMRQAQLLSVVAAPQQLLYVAQTETLPCEYLSLDVIERWIILGLAVCHQMLGQPVFAKMWQTTLEGSLCIRLFRDEVLVVHQYMQQYFDSIKGNSKRVSELKEYYNAAVQNAGLLHRDRRKFIRSALHELCLVFADQPGLLGPKVLFVFMALSSARDEVQWLLRHHDVWPTKQQSKLSRGQEDVLDRHLPELLFRMEELRHLLCKYVNVIQRYYMQYLSGYDAILLNDLIQKLSNVSEDESVILSSICNAIADLNIDMLNDMMDFRALRLDWCRFQAYTSVAKSSFQLKDNRKLAHAVNNTIFHLKMLDYIDEITRETSDLSIYCFYTKQLEQHFQSCLEFPSQTRFVVAFPQICSHFMNCLHELCPEERIHIGEKSLSLCNMFLEEMAKEAKNIITNICDQHCQLSDRLLPKHVARLIDEALAKRRQQQKTSSKGGTTERKAGAGSIEVHMPGDESYRRSREEMSMLDKLHYAVTELCYSINSQPKIMVWEHTFAPREYLTQHLENRFNKSLVAMTMYNADKQEIAKPSELLSSVRAYMNVLQAIENHVHMDIARIFNNVLLQQTQPQDSHGDETITTLYTRWYLEVLLRRVSTSQILFTPFLRSFINNANAVEPGGAPAAITFNAQEYTDAMELRALAEMLGVYGIKFLCERLIWHVASQVSELKKLVQQNKEVLRAMRGSFDKPERMRELAKQLTMADATRKNADVVDNLLQRVNIIGEILSFKSILQKALNDALANRTPYLLSTIEDFHRNFPDEHPEQLEAYEMCSAAGVSCAVDASLVSSIRAQMQNESVTDEDYTICCLLMVFIAVALPKLAKSEGSYFKAALAAHLNNSHCIAMAVNTVAGALFTLHARGDVMDRMKEFLALASSSLLRMSHEPDVDQMKNKESVYVLLDQIVDDSPWLSVDLLESCFPYILLRSSYHYCYKHEEYVQQSSS